jgi:hypothetical protein
VLISSFQSIPNRRLPGKQKSRLYSSLLAAITVVLFIYADYLFISPFFGFSSLKAAKLAADNFNPYFVAGFANYTQRAIHLGCDDKRLAARQLELFCLE